MKFFLTNESKIAIKPTIHYNLCLKNFENVSNFEEWGLILVAYKKGKVSRNSCFSEYLFSSFSNSLFYFKLYKVSPDPTPVVISL